MQCLVRLARQEEDADCAGDRQTEQPRQEMPLIVRLRIHRENIGHRAHQEERSEARENRKHRTNANAVLFRDQRCDDRRNEDRARLTDRRQERRDDVDVSGEIQDRRCDDHDHQQDRDGRDPSRSFDLLDSLRGFGGH
jgi:hypothetical protein